MGAFGLAPAGRVLNTLTVAADPRAAQALWQEGCVTAQRVEQPTVRPLAGTVPRPLATITPRPLAGVVVGALFIALMAAGCTRPVAGSIDIAPTYIPQPTPDPTMREVIAGRGAPVVYLPPIEVRGSPTAAPAASRPGTGTTTRPAAKPTAPAQSAREPEPARAPAPGREAAPAPKPAAPTPAPAPKPAPILAPTRTAPSTGGAGRSATPPSLFNPSNVLPGGATRPNATPSR
jgi:hypothetical protein